MMHGSTRPLVPSLRWRTALRRGFILGGVTALHLGSVALLLRPVSPYRSPRVAAHVSQSPLQIHFVVRRKPSHRASPPSVRQPVPPPRHVVAATPSAAIPKMPARVDATHSVADIPARPGDYRSAAFDVWQGEPNPHLPGSTDSPGSGIRLRDRPSMREVVRTMTTASRCKYERMKMAQSATQFVTRQLMDRALHADGCGPQQPGHAAADSSIDATSRQVIFGE